MTARHAAHGTLRDVVLCAAVGLTAAVDLHAASIRVWPSAVVVTESIRIDDLCELRGFDHKTESRLAQLRVGDAPVSGGSRLVHLEMIRAALVAQGINLGDVTFGGAIRCEVSRPPAPESGADRQSSATPGHAEPAASRYEPRNGADTRNHASASRVSDGSEGAVAVPSTLRNAVIEHFNAELSRFHGTAEVVFDHTDEQVLELSGPDYSFHVRTRDEAKLGLTPLEVDVSLHDRVVQTVPLVVQVSMLRPTVVARRAINQDAAIQSSDVDLVPLRYAVLNRLGIDDTARVIGQRAKRLIRAGATIDPELLEQVPLVLRGQLVSVTSVVGGVRVVTSGKAAGDGMLGAVVTIRTADSRKADLDAVVVGPGQVQLGGRLPAAQEKVAALGSGS